MNKQKPKPTNKGDRAEEALRHYFKRLGYFVVRGAKVTINGTDVTDVDLWLYNRLSPVSRERINVDVKNKKTPQALERIFWAKGVQNILGYDRSIVATTSKDPFVAAFGKSHAVSIIDGAMLATLTNVKGTAAAISDEEFQEWSTKNRESKSESSWYELANQCASVLATNLYFDGCNSILERIKFFLEQVVMGNSRSQEALRYSYLLISYFLITLDFCLSTDPFVSQAERHKILTEGLRFGSAGQIQTKKITDLAIKMASAFDNQLDRQAMQDAVSSASKDYPVEILSDYFSMSPNSRNNFSQAKKFNDMAFSLDLDHPDTIAKDLKSTLYVILDFFGIDRKKIIAVFEDLSDQPSLAFPQ